VGGVLNKIKSLFVKKPQCDVCDETEGLRAIGKFKLCPKCRRKLLLLYYKRKREVRRGA